MTYTERKGWAGQRDEEGKEGKEGKKGQGEDFLHKSSRNARCLDRDLTRARSPPEEKTIANY